MIEHHSPAVNVDLIAGFVGPLDHRGAVSKQRLGPWHDDGNEQRRARTYLSVLLFLTNGVLEVDCLASGH